MNKKFSTLAALLLASGAGYTLVQAALSEQGSFKPGVNYVIGVSSNNALTNALDVVRKTVGIDVAPLDATLTYAAATVWGNKLVEGKAYLVKGDLFVNATDLSLQVSSVGALEIKSKATTFELMSGANYLLLSKEGKLKVAATQDEEDVNLYASTTANTAVAVPTAAATVATQFAISSIAKTVTWEATDAVLKDDAVDAVWSEALTDIKWEIALNNAKDGFTAEGAGSKFISNKSGGGLEMATTGEEVDFFLDTDGAIMNGSDFLSKAYGSDLALTTTPTKLYLYEVKEDGVAPEPTKVMKAGSYVIAPLNVAKDAAKDYVFVSEESTTFVGATPADAKNHNWKIVPAGGDSVYVLNAELNEYLGYTVDASGAALNLTKEQVNKFCLDEDKLASTYGNAEGKKGAEYFLKIATTAVSFETTGSDIDVYTDLTKAPALLTGTTVTEFTTDSTVVGTPADGDYLFFILDGQYLSVNQRGAIEVLDAKPSTAADALRASWIYSDGKYISAARKDLAASQLTLTEGKLSKAATDITTPFTLTGAGSTFSYVGGSLMASTTVDKKDASAYVLKDADGNFIASIDAAKGTRILMDQKLSLVAAPASPTALGQALATSVVAGDYYMLSDGHCAIGVDDDGKSIAATKANAADAKFLWKMKEELNSGVFSYSFVNKSDNKIQLTIEGKTTFLSCSKFNYNTAKGLVLRSGDKFITIDETTPATPVLKLDDNGEAKTFGLYSSGDAVYSAYLLNNKLNNAFVLGTTLPTGKTLEESALMNQELRAVWMKFGTEAPAQYFVVKSSWKNIPNDLYELNSPTDYYTVAKESKAALKDVMFVSIGIKQYGLEDITSGKGFVYSTVGSADLFDFATGLAKANLAKAQFTTTYSLASQIKPEDLKDMNSLIITQTVNFGSLEDVTVRPQVMVAEVLNQTTNVKEDKYFLLTQATDVQTTWSVINFSSTGVVKEYFDGKAYNAYVGNTKENGYTKEGWIYGPKYDDLVDTTKTQVDLTTPETQFIIRYETPEHNSEGFYIYNRESKSSRFLGASIYKVKDSDTKYYIPNAYVYGDTITLVETELCHPRLGGYAHYTEGDADVTFDAVNLAQTAYRIGIKNGAFDGIAYISNSAVHNNQLSVNIKDEDGLRFYFVPTVDTVAYGLNNTDKKFTEIVGDAAKDSLYRISYAIQERSTKRFVGFDEENRVLELNADIREAKYAQQFFIKEKGNGKFVIVVRHDYKYTTYNESNKIFANIGDASLHEADIYAPNIADEFILDTVAAPKYANILTTSKADSDTTLVKINLFSVENQAGASSYMLASGENNFLVEGVPAKSLKATGGLEYPAVNFDLVVDTAYVNRAGNTMPLYYLGMNGTARKDSVGPEHPSNDDCSHFELNDTVAGKFLFAMYDSIYFGKDKAVVGEAHCYHYTNTEHFARLRFVDAKHVKDTMYIGTGVAAKDTLKAGVVKTNILGNRQVDWLNGFAPANDLKEAIKDHQEYITLANDNFGLFAFEINPANDKEYAIYSPATGMYVAYINGNVVMARQASYYTMVKSNEIPTTNENVETTEVTVIAGNGQVTIQNAAGKTVAICNILGQTLANTVITSDNATINVPAGIAVVAIEGEEAVKAIVK